MSDPGFTHRNLTVVGIVQPIEWGEWDIKIQRASAFAVEGQSIIYGGRTLRDLSFPLTLNGFVTQIALETALQSIETNFGFVGRLQLRVAGGVVIFDEANVLFRGLKRGKASGDALHGFYRHCVWHFQQLAPG